MGYSYETEDSGKTLRDYISGNYQTTSCLKEELLVSWYYKYSKLYGEMYTLVGSLGKRPSKTQDLVDWAGWKCTLRNVMIAEPSEASLSCHDKNGPPLKWTLRN